MHNELLNALPCVPTSTWYEHQLLMLRHLDRHWTKTVLLFLQFWNPKDPCHFLTKMKDIELLVGAYFCEIPSDSRVSIAVSTIHERVTYRWDLDACVLRCGSRCSLLQPPVLLNNDTNADNDNEDMIPTVMNDATSHTRKRSIYSSLINTGT